VKDFRVLIISENPETIQFALEEEYRVSLSRGDVHGKPDLIVLDLSGDLHDEVFAPCDALRQRKDTKYTPILVLSESVDPEFRAKALFAGADGYIQKPFNENELLAHVHARLRTVRLDSNKIECGNLVLNVDNQEVLIDGKLVGISTLEFQLLHYFAANVGRLVTRKALLDALWRDSIVSERTIDAHMAILRKKLADFSYRFQTVYGSGYRLKEAPEK
jgi:DNA-binding response OmpR family regulator